MEDKKPVKKAAPKVAKPAAPKVAKAKAAPVEKVEAEVVEASVVETVAMPVAEVAPKVEKVTPKVTVASTKKAPAKRVPVVADPSKRNSRKEREGIVVSDKMDKTCIVAIIDKFKHKLYKKTISKTKRIKAHDENNECGIGDTVVIAETRPISKDKHWRLVRIVEKAK